MLISRKHRDFLPLVNLIALYYQIRDDYMNLQSEEVSTISPLVCNISLTALTTSTSQRKASLMTLLRGNSRFPSFMEFIPKFKRVTRADFYSVSRCLCRCLPSFRTAILIPLLPDILQKRPTTTPIKNVAISYLRSNTKSFEYTLNVLRSLKELVLKEIEQRGGNSKLVEMMNNLEVKEGEKTI